MRILVHLGLVTILLLLVLLWLKPQFSDPINQNNRNPISIAQPNNDSINYTASLKLGKQVFRHNCLACHGEDGRKGTLGAFDLSQSVLPKKERLQVITEGRNAMPTFKTQLTPVQINAVANYITLLRK